MRLKVRSLRQAVKGDLAIEFVPQRLTSYGGLELFGALDVLVREEILQGYLTDSALDDALRNGKGETEEHLVRLGAADVGGGGFPDG